MSIPGEGRDSCCVSGHSPQLAAGDGVVNHEKSLRGANGQMKATLYPADAGDVIAVEFAQLVDLSGFSTPEINTVSKADRQYVIWAPVDEIEVEVVCQLRCVKNLIGNFAHRSRRLPRRKQHVL